MSINKPCSMNTWPNLSAPAKYENHADGWEDDRVPDLVLIWKLAREVGYAVGLHGSLKRDMDLIAFPWTDEAVGNWELVEHLCAGLPAVRIGGPEHKPHGRVAVTLQMDGYYKPIDLSIAPRNQALALPAQEVERLKQLEKNRRDEGDHLIQQLAAMTAERDAAMESTYVPGSWSCPVCQFAQVNSVLCATSGRVGADTESVPLCPNDGALMKRETWKGYAVAYEKSLVEKLQQLATLQATLAERERRIQELEARPR